MASRHRKPKPTQSIAMHEPKPDRQVEHRRVRRNANQELHLTAQGLDPDELVYHEPHHTHGYYEPSEKEVAAAKPNRMRHWKQKFWKRRTVERRNRARLATELD